MILMSALLGVSINAQTPAATASPKPTTQTDEKPKRQNFRANKEQITKAQKMLKVAESGKMDAETKMAVKTYQGENGLRKSGSLNRASRATSGSLRPTIRRCRLSTATATSWSRSS